MMPFLLSDQIVVGLVLTNICCAAKQAEIHGDVIAHHIVAYPESEFDINDHAKHSRVQSSALRQPGWQALQIILAAATVIFT